MNELDTLESAVRASIGASVQAAPETTIGRICADRRLSVERRWEGQCRWIYVTPVDEPSLPNTDYALFLGWYSDPPGETFWEGRRLGDLDHAIELITLWVIQGAPPETLPPPK